MKDHGSPHGLAIGSWHNNYAQEDDEGTPTSRVLNRLLAVTHVENANVAVDLFTGLVIPSDTPSTVLDAAVIAAALKSAPIAAVSAVGVSAVSDAVAAKLWVDAVESSCNFGWDNHA